jgi:nucleoside-diphosphate-sugar epimerase
MHVLVAGASGAIGVPLVRALVSAGHRVTGLTRSSSHGDLLRSLGAEPSVADALDAGAVRRVLETLRPTHVVHELTALPKHGPRRWSDLQRTNRLRIEGTRNLIDASAVAGVSRILIGSFVFAHVESAAVSRGMAAAVDAIHSMESQALEASRAGLMQAVVLRYGMFYGRDLTATRAMMAAAKHRLLPLFGGDRSLLPAIQIDDAAAATVLALERGSDRGVYDIVDDQPMSLSDLIRVIADAAGAPKPFTVPGLLTRLSPYLSDVLSLRLRIPNAKAKAELGWRLRFPSAVEGLRTGARRAA